MPNKRRRRLSTSLSAVAALAIASPFAIVAVSEAITHANSHSHHEFVPAASITDLPGELIGALSQGLSQFGVNLPPAPGSFNPGLTAPGLTAPGLTNPGLTAPGLTAPGLTNPVGTVPGLTNPAGTVPGLTNPAGAVPGLTNPVGTVPGLTNPAGTVPGLTNPAANAPGLTAPGLTNPARTVPGLTNPGLTNPNAGLGEVPISSAGVGLEPGVDGTYPILGDPAVGFPAEQSSGPGGLVNNLVDAANQLGASQAVDLLKGALTQAVQSAAGAAAAANQ